MRANERGQTLVMMSLMVLLLTLMVMMTVSIGSKVKEKMELQTTADTMAYSNAVATARTYNTISTMNRVGIAHVTGITAIHALVSWASYYAATLKTALPHYEAWLLEFTKIFNSQPDGCCPIGGKHVGKFCFPGIMCACSTYGMKSNALIIESLFGAQTLFAIEAMALDQQAADEARAYMNSADFIHLLGQVPAVVVLNSFLGGQSGAGHLVKGVQAGTPYDELSAAGTPGSINQREAGAGGALLPVNLIYAHHVFAAMGGRLHPFITSRTGLGNPSMLINAKLMTLITPIDAASVQTGTGSSSASMLSGPEHGSNPIWAYASRYFGADDHTEGKLRSEYYSPMAIMCRPKYTLKRATAVLVYLYGGSSDNLHVGLGAADMFHFFPGATNRTYPWFVDYNFFTLDDEKDVWGQPKNFGIAQRDYSARPFGGADQWNPFFHFTYSASGSGSQYDNRAVVMKDGTYIGNQRALATGITYYHRGNNAFGYHSGVEPPNFFNPFWRAGLTHVDVDDPGMGSDDVPSALGHHSAATDAFEGLRAAGFKGWQ